MEYILNLEKSTGSPKNERKLSHTPTPQQIVQQFDVTFEKEIQSLLDTKKNEKTKIIAVILFNLDSRSSKQWKI